MAADVTSEDEVREYVRAAVDKFGTIDAFYNNAGIEGDIKPITEYSLEMFRRVLDVNVVGVFLGMKHVLPVMLKQNKGSIINTASIAGLMGSPLIAVYSASKHAVIGLTKTAAWECTGTGVRVNCVCPGLIDSRMLSTILQGRNPGNTPPPEDKIVDRIPARRLGQASEVASIVAFLASDEASYVSGSAYTVDGGQPPLRVSSFRGALKARNPESRDCPLQEFPDVQLHILGSRLAHRPGNDRKRKGVFMPVTLDPDAAAVFKAFQEAGRPAYETLSPAEAREFYLAGRVVSNPEPPELASVQPLSIPAPHGSIPARVYTPKSLRKTDGLAPVLVFFHGGGWVIGDLNSHEAWCAANSPTRGSARA